MALLAAGLTTLAAIAQEREEERYRRVELARKPNTGDRELLLAVVHAGGTYRVRLPPKPAAEHWVLRQVEILGPPGGFRILVTYDLPEGGLARWQRLFEVKPPQIFALGPTWSRTRPPLSLPSPSR